MRTLLLILLATSCVLAQDDAPGTIVPPPMVRPDRTVTLRWSAPSASGVMLMIRGAGFKPQPMTKGPKGIWEITVGPLEPEIYEYAFVVDGTVTQDTNNHSISNAGPTSRYFEVTSTPPRFDQVQDVPHGAIHLRTYQSAMRKETRQMYVYVPPSYETSPNRRYPVLYLRHGNGGDETGWSALGGERAGIILDNLIAQKKATEMIVVMDRDYPVDEADQYTFLASELLSETIPFVEKLYRLRPGRENRALAGLSMGGRQALNIGLSHLDAFAYVGEFSGGASGLNPQQWPAAIVGNPVSTNEQLKLLFLACGTEDSRFDAHNKADAWLKSNNVRHVYFTTPGGHEPKVWRHALYEFVQKLF